MSPYDLENDLIHLCYQDVDLEFTYAIPIYNIILHQTDMVHTTPLMLACIENPQAIALLLSQGVNINATNKNGTTALMFAAQTRNFLATQILCKYKKNLDINKQDSIGNSALLWSFLPTPYAAAQQFFASLTKSILNAGADPELANNSGLTPLQAAQNAESHVAVKIITQAIDTKYARPK